MSDHEHRIKVWDIPTRLFHWLLVVAVGTGLITGFISPEWWMGIHIWAGYGTVLLVVFRLVWGVFGSEYSRIETFAFTPGEVIAHLRELIFLRPLHYIGHNPVGAMMIFALIFFLFGITISGLLVLGGEENQGPLAGVISYQVGDVAAEVHEVLVFVLMVLISLHIIGVILEMRLTGENLITPMFNGHKVIPEGEVASELRSSKPLLAAIFLFAFAVISGSVLWALSTMPPSGIIQLAKNANYTAECGDCHEVYHPSLLPKASWAKLMKDLENHFGEDASLDQGVTDGIAGYLQAHAAEAWDTEASNRFSKVSSTTTHQITATAYWKRKHKDIGAEVFKRKGVGGKVHCSSCHLDAASGRFDDQKIKIPEQ